MIDRETAITWAKDAGFGPSLEDYGLWLSTADRIQALITRAQNEAFERAAQECDSLSDLANHPDDVNGYGCAAAIRALKVG